MSLWQCVPSAFHHFVSQVSFTKLIQPDCRRYFALSPRTRIALGLGTIAYCTFALYATDEAEKVFGFEPGEEEKKRLMDAIPTVRVVDRVEEGKWKEGR